MPFRNQTGDSGQEAFVDALTDEIIDSLTCFRHQTVAPSGAVFAFKDQSATVEAVARELAVGYVLEGTVRETGPRLRVAVQLIEGSEGRQVWSERYERAADDPDAARRDIVRGIASEAGTLDFGWVSRAILETARRKPAAERDAHDWLLLAIEYQNRLTREGIVRSKELTENALELDPDYAIALDNHTWDYLYEWKFGWSADSVASRERAFELSQRALDLDPESPDLHWTMASVYLHARGDFDAAEAEYQKALSLNPNAADILANWGGDLPYLGRAAEGVEAVRKAIDLNPIHPGWYEWCFGSAAYTARQYGDAVHALENATEAGALADIYLAASYAQLGRVEEAQAVAARVRADHPEQSVDDWVSRCPFKLDADREHLRDGMNKAWDAVTEHRAAPQAGHPKPSEHQQGKPSVAVLPFKNQTGDDGQADFVDSFTDEIIDGLSRFRSHAVVASRSAFAYKDKALTVQEIGRELGARYVVEGTVRREDGRLKVTARLVDAESGEQVWSKAFDRAADDGFVARDEITRFIAGELGTLDKGPLSRAMVDDARRKSDSSRTAHDYYMLAIDEQSHITLEGIARSIAFAEKALALDPGDAVTMGTLAWNHLYGWVFGWTESPEKTAARGIELARQALALDPANANLHWTMAGVHLHLRQDHAAAEAEYMRALSINPDAADILADWGGDLIFFGRAEEGIEIVRRAMVLNPVHPGWYEWCLGAALYSARRYEEAIPELEGAVDAGPAATMVLAASYAQLGRLDEARPLAARIRADFPG